MKFYKNQKPNPSIIVLIHITITQKSLSIFVYSITFKVKTLKVQFSKMLSQFLNKDYIGYVIS